MSLPRAMSWRNAYFEQALGSKDQMTEQQVRASVAQAEGDAAHGNRTDESCKRAQCRDG